MKTLTVAAIRCSLMFTAVAALSIAYPAKANLITNPGFETGDFTGWTSFHASVVGTAFGVPPHSGNFQAQFIPERRGDQPDLFQSVSMTPGASYTISFFLALANVGLDNSGKFRERQFYVRQQ